MKKTLEEMLAALKDIDTKLDALLAHDELSAEQKAEHDRLVAERAKTVAAIDKEKNRIAREEERTKLEAEAAAAKKAREERERRTVNPGQNRLTDPDQANRADVPAERTRITIPAAASRWAGNLQHFRGERDGHNAEERAYRFGMWAMATLSRQMPGRYNFREAVEFVDRHMGAVGSNDSSGAQYLIPEEFGRDIIVLRETFGKVRMLFRREPMISDTKTDPRRTGGLTAYFVGENQAATESNMTWDQVRLVARDLVALTRISRQVNADSVINWGDTLIGEIVYAFSEKEDQCGFNGDGTSTYGGIQGIRHKLQNLDAAGTDSAGLVIQGTGNTWAALVLADFDKVVGKLPEFADTPEASWLCHRTFYYEVMEKLVQAAGGVPAYEIRQGQRARPLFKGYPVNFSQVFPKVTAVATVSCTLGAYKLGAAFGDRQQEEIAFSEHATVGGENVFERGQIAVRGSERFDINCHDVGSSTDPGPIVGLQTGP